MSTHDFHAEPAPAAPHEQHYIGSTEISSTPHVTVHWDGDRLTSVEVSNLNDAEELTWAQFRQAWRMVPKIRRERTW